MPLEEAQGCLKPTFCDSVATMLTETDIQRNLRAVDHAVAQQELEGLKVPESSVANLRRIARGEIQSDEENRNIYSRFKHVPLFHP